VAPRPALPAPGSALRRPAQRARAVPSRELLPIGMSHSSRGRSAGSRRPRRSIVQLAAAASRPPYGRRFAMASPT
jgi:hypothetical protein